MSFGSDNDPPSTLTAAASFCANGSLSDLISHLIGHTVWVGWIPKKIQNFSF